MNKLGNFISNFGKILKPRRKNDQPPWPVVIVLWFTIIGSMLAMLGKGEVPFIHDLGLALLITCWGTLASYGALIVIVYIVDWLVSYIVSDKMEFHLDTFLFGEGYHSSTTTERNIDMGIYVVLTILFGAGSFLYLTPWLGIMMISGVLLIQGIKKAFNFWFDVNKQIKNVEKEES